MRYTPFLILIFSLSGTICVAQDSLSDHRKYDQGIALPVRGSCKGYVLSYYQEYRHAPAQRMPSGGGSGHSSLIRIHGNILYDVNYRSFLDTPYADKEAWQHMAQTYLDITYKDHYPFRIFLTTRWGNSPWFRNYTDLNFLYNAGEFNNQLRRQVKSLIQSRLWDDSLAALKKLLAIKEKNFYSLQKTIDTSGKWDRLLAMREKQWISSLGRSAQAAGLHPDSAGLPNLDELQRFNYKGFHSLSKMTDAGRSDTEDSSAHAARIDSVKKRLDSLGPEIIALQNRLRDIQDLRDKNTMLAKEDIDQITSGRELKNRLNELHIPDSSLPKGYQTLYSVRSFGIGRAMVDYSELSARNISITGVQLEYNPSYYLAVAAGTVDYRFRDYTMQNPAKGQYLGLVRYGWGRKEGNNVIFTYYRGRRQLYNSYTGAQGSEIPNFNLMGFTVEGHYKITRTSTLTAEMAKSSSPYYSLDSTKPQHNVLGSALKMNDHTNEAYSLKFNYFLPVTRTWLDASYKHYGANFQSFSLFTTGAEQNSWSVRIDQPLFKHHLQLTGSLRTNDFTNPLVSASYKSSTVFKSIQATWRAKNWPTLSAGYFPSSQIIKLSDHQFQENLFYMLTGNASYIYKIKGVSTITMLMYSQFYNKVTDSNFVYFNTKNLLLSQSVFMGRLTAQLQLSAAMNTTYNLYVVDQKADYKIKTWLSVGVGIKYNRQTVYDITQWGYSGNAVLQVPRVGEFRLQADKGFIPGNNRQLVVNKIGRLTYFKIL